MHSLPQLLISALLALASHSDAPSPQTVQLAARIGVTAESLVVAGFSANEAQSIVDELGTNGDYASALAAARSLVDTKAAALAAAEASLQGSPENSELIAARNTARTELLAAQAAFRAAPAAARAALVASADSGKKAILETYAAGAGRSAPPEFKAISRTNEEWTALESALRAEARAARRGEELASEKASLLSSARSNEDVAAAKTRLDNTLAAVKAAMAPAVQQ